MTDYVQIATGQVIVGMYIPMHDATLDIAEEVGKQLTAFREYITSVRTAEQADSAVTELLAALMAGRTV